MKNLTRTAFYLSLILILNACGGSGGSSDNGDDSVGDDDVVVDPGTGGKVPITGQLPSNF